MTALPRPEDGVRGDLAEQAGHFLAEAALDQVQGDLDRDRDAQALYGQQVRGREPVAAVIVRAACPEDSKRLPENAAGPGAGLK